MPDRSERQRAPNDVAELDARSLKALAHPLRVRLLARLRTHGPATASKLAAALGTNSGQTSYHLRMLADAGLVEEDERRGTARERYWQARHRATRIEPAAFSGDPASRERMRWLQGEIARAHARMLDCWLDEMDGYDAAWHAAAGMSDWMLRLTPEQLSALKRELGEVIERYGRAETEAGDAGERVQIQLHAFPARELSF